MADTGSPLQELQLKLEAPAAWVSSRVQGVVKGAQHTFDRWTHLLQPGKANFTTTLWDVPQNEELRQLSLAGKNPPNLQQKLECQLQAWRRNSSWVDETPALEVTVPKGTLCKFVSRFKIGIPPDAVYNILTDPNNKRVFKNIQEVKYRNVLEDDGERQLVELEQLASWRFLWLSGTLSASVLVDQDRRTHTVKYWLAKSGFMKRFEGTWKIEPLLIDDSGAPVWAPDSGEERVASVVTLQQVWQSVIIPPPPFVGYVRGITTKSTEGMIQELQAEGKRLREGTSEEVDTLESLESQDVAPLVDQWKLPKRFIPGRRKPRRSRWRLRSG